MRISIPAIGRHIWCSLEDFNPFSNSSISISDIYHKIIFPCIFANAQFITRETQFFFFLQNMENFSFFFSAKGLCYSCFLFFSGFSSPPQTDFYWVSKYAAVFMNNWVVRWFAADPVSGFVPAPWWTTATLYSPYIHVLRPVKFPPT